jgi:phage tail-like protein
VNLHLVTIDRFVEIIDLDLAKEQELDRLLVSLGNPFGTNLTTADKRRLVAHLVPIFQSKGTEAGIKGAIRFFFGLEVAVSDYTGGSNQLGLDQLGDSFVLDPSVSYLARSFTVTVPRVLTDEERLGVRSIVKLMKPANTHNVGGTFGIVEPGNTIDHLELGLSRLGDAPFGTNGTNGTWILH